jgi:aminopeptidase N
MVAQRQEGQKMQVPDGLFGAFGGVLQSEGAEPALIAEVLSLPAISYLGDFMDTVDIDGLYQAREAVRKLVGQALNPVLRQAYQAMSDDGEYRPTAAAIGRRSLKNRVLAYLMAAGDAHGGELCESQYRAQHNMTDVMAALALLADSEHASREAVLADFESRWQSDPLVMDKWFAVQAMSGREDALSQVRQLMLHPGFSMRNPNRVRALIGSFANANPVRFHSADGSGYAFLAEQVLALDASNPQIAARLLRAISRWRRYDEGRQTHMRAALEAVVATKVSRDVYEIATKSLEAE